MMLLIGSSECLSLETEIKNNNLFKLEEIRKNRLEMRNAIRLHVLGRIFLALFALRSLSSCKR